MKLLVITTQRCGSTWVARTLADLLDSKTTYIPDIKVGIRTPQLSDFQAGQIYGRLCWNDHVYKTHSVGIHHALQAANRASDLRIVSVRREFKDVFVSRVFFERYFKVRMKQANSSPFIDYLTVSEDLDDVDFINGYLETPGFQRLVENWADLSVETGHPQHLRIDYEKMRADPTAEATKLAKFVGADLDRVGSAVKQNQFRAHSTNDHSRFERRGEIGDHVRHLTPESIDFIDRAVADCLANQPRYIFDKTLW